MPQDHIVAVALLTKGELDRLGDTFTRVWPVEDVPCFEELLAAIDKAEDRLQDRSTTTKP